MQADIEPEHDATAQADAGELPGSGMLARAFALLRALGEMQPRGARVTQLAKAVQLTQGTTHRILRALIAQGMVEQDQRTKLYRLGVDFFALAAQAGDPGECVRCAGLRC